MRQEPGKYVIKIYDELGSKHKVIIATNLLHAEALAEEAIEDMQDYSYTISRVLINSRVKRSKYS